MMEDFNSETESDYTSYWKDWVGLDVLHLLCRKGLSLDILDWIMCFVVNCLSYIKSGVLDPRYLRSRKASLRLCGFEHEASLLLERQDWKSFPSSVYQQV